MIPGERRYIYLDDSYSEFYHVITRRPLIVRSDLPSEKDRSELRET